MTLKIKVAVSLFQICHAQWFTRFFFGNTQLYRCEDRMSWLLVKTRSQGEWTHQGWKNCHALSIVTLCRLDLNFVPSITAYKNAPKCGGKIKISWGGSVPPLASQSSPRNEILATHVYLLFLGVHCALHHILWAFHTPVCNILNPFNASWMVQRHTGLTHHFYRATLC